jgi:hypothetical protein
MKNDLTLTRYEMYQAYFKALMKNAFGITRESHTGYLMTMRLCSIIYGRMIVNNKLGGTWKKTMEHLNLNSQSLGRM